MSGNIKMLCIWIFLIISLPCFLFTQEQLKQEDLFEMSIEELMNVKVVTASRHEQKMSEAPATAIIITEDQIKNRNYQSLLDVLHDLPDFKIDYQNDPRWLNDITVRGIFGMEKLLILMDGVRISSPTNDIIPIMENYPVHFAKQIEIVYGPASALYGADAFSGVINIITKKPEDIAGSVEVSAYGGMFNTYLGNFLIGKKIRDKINFMFAGLYFYDQQPDLSDYYPDDYKGGKEALKSGNFNTAFGLITPATPVSPEFKMPLYANAIYASMQIYNLQLGLFRNHSQNPTTIANNPNNAVYNENVFIGHNINVLSGKYEVKGARVNSTSILVGSRYNLNTRSNFRNVYTRMEHGYKFSYGWMMKAEELVTWNVQKNITLTSGFTFERFFSIPRGHDLQNPIDDDEWGDPKEVIVNSQYPNNPDGIEADFNKVKYSNVGGFVQGQLSPNSNFNFTLGTRYDSNTRFGGTFNPRLSATWFPSKLISVKAFYGSAFLAPSPLAAYDQFGTFYSEDDGLTYKSKFFRLPNPDLGPQKVKTMELNVYAFLSDELSVSIIWYHNRLTGLFHQVSDADYGNRYNGQYKGWPVEYIETVINQGEQVNYGGTLKIDYLTHFSTTNRLLAYSSLSYVDGWVDPDDKGPEGKVEIGGVARFILRIGGELNIKKLVFSPQLTIVGKQRTHPVAVAAFKPDDPTKRQTLNGYTLLNLAIRYQIAKNVNIFTNVKNALDIRYRGVNLGAAPETGAAGSAQAEFAKGSPQYPRRIMAGVQVKF